MTKNQLFEELIREGVLKTPKSLETFKAVDRADFVLPEYLDVAYENHPLPIGFGQTISQPYTVAFMIDLLVPKAGDKILDIGCGSGWTTALLSYLVGRKGKIIGIERIPQLAEMARENLLKYSKLQRTRRRQGFGGQASTIEIICGNGAKGYVKEAPFDKIIAAATAEDIPAAWKEQLKIGGRIVAPVQDSIVVIDKISAQEFKTTAHWGFVFVPLIRGSLHPSRP